MRVLFLRAAIGLACLPAAAGAQTLALTESEAVARLSSESPRVQAVRSAVDVARAGVLDAARWPNPRVTYNREAVAGVTEHMTMVAQTLPITGRRRLDVLGATARVDASVSRAEDEMRRLEADLRLAFTDLRVAQMRERELARSRDRLRELAGILARREAAGESPGFDRLRAERELLDVDADRATAASERARAQGALIGFFPAVPDVPVIEALAPDRAPAALPSVDELTARAETRGAFVALQRELDAAAFAGRAAGRTLIPEPELVAGTKASNAGAGDLGSIVSVHVTVPLFDRARPERAAAVARERQVRAEADALRLTVRAQIAAWRAAVIERRQIAEQYRVATGTTAEEIERIAQVSYEAGEQGILELLDAHRTAASARVRQALLDAAVREAEIELEFVSGGKIQ